MTEIPLVLGPPLGDSRIRSGKTGPAGEWVGARPGVGECQTVPFGPDNCCNFSVLQIVADVAPSIATRLLGEALELQRVHNRSDTGVDAVAAQWNTCRCFSPLFNPTTQLLRVRGWFLSLPCATAVKRHPKLTRCRPHGRPAAIDATKMAPCRYNRKGGTILTPFWLAAQ